MYKNNFDMSSTGTNIEVCAIYDNTIASIEFENTFQRIYQNFYFFNQYGNNELPDNFQILGEKENMIEYLRDFTSYEKEELERYSKKWLVNEIIETSELTYRNFNEIEERLEYYDLELLYPENVQEYISRGYCQGDYAKILYIADKEDEVIEKEINHLLWDSPVYAIVTINDKEYDYYDYDLPRYEWKKEKFIKNIMEDVKESDKEYIRKILEILLPDDLDYN